MKEFFLFILKAILNFSLVVFAVFLIWFGLYIERKINAYLYQDVSIEVRSK